jgi:hypothetical protein
VFAGAAIDDARVELSFERQDASRKDRLSYRAGKRRAPEGAAFGKRDEVTQLLRAGQIVNRSYRVRAGN